LAGRFEDFLPTVDLAVRELSGIDSEPILRATDERAFS
jgi:hypothetical protein